MSETMEADGPIDDDSEDMADTSEECAPDCAVRAPAEEPAPPARELRAPSNSTLESRA